MGLIVYSYFLFSKSTVVRLFAIGELCMMVAAIIGISYFLMNQRDTGILIVQIGLVVFFAFTLIGFAYRISVNQLAVIELEQTVSDNQDSLKTQQNHIQNLERSLIEAITETEYHPSQHQDDILFNLLSMIHAEIKNPQFGVALIAEKMHMSHRQLNRKIREVTGRSASQYVIDVRLVLARRLLKADKSIGLKEIAEAVGLQDQNYLAKKLIGKYGASFDLHKSKKVKEDLANSRNSEEDKEWLGEVHYQIVKNLNLYDFNADFLAAQMQISKRQLERRIKKLTGLSIGNYIRNQRFEKALELLENRKVKNIKLLVKQIGLKDLTNFSRKFYRRFGKLPSDYLK